MICLREKFDKRLKECQKNGLQGNLTDAFFENCEEQIRYCINRKEEQKKENDKKNGENDRETSSDDSEDENDEDAQKRKKEKTTGVPAGR